MESHGKARIKALSNRNSFCNKISILPVLVRAIGLQVGALTENGGILIRRALGSGLSKDRAHGQDNVELQN